MIFEVLSLSLVALWMLDAYFTISVLKRKGMKKEDNKLLRAIYRHSPAAFLAFKAMDLLLVLTIFYLISINYLVTADTLLLIFIYAYAQVDWNNYKVWKKTFTKNPKTPSPGNEASLER